MKERDAWGKWPPPLTRVVDIYDDAVEHSPQLKRGLVWCTECGERQRVDSAECLRTGWPKHCGYTMTLDSPEERRAAGIGLDDRDRCEGIRS